MPEDTRNFHHHISSEIESTGSQSKCILCPLDIMFIDGKWTPLYAIDSRKAEKYRSIFKFDSLTGGHL